MRSPRAREPVEVHEKSAHTVQPTGAGRAGVAGFDAASSEGGPEWRATPSGTHKERRELKNPGYEIFIGVLSMLSILNLVLLYVVAERPGPALHPLRDERAAQRDLLRRLLLPPLHGTLEVRLLLPAVRLGRPARQPAVPPGQDPAAVPGPAGLPAAPRVRRPHASCSVLARRPRRQRALHPAADGHPGAGVRQPGHGRHRGGRPRREHHQRVRRALVHDRHDLDRRVRRPVPGDERRAAGGRRSSSSSASASSARSPATWRTCSCRRRTRSRT